jgi:Na+/pantothenate symporter
MFCVERRKAWRMLQSKAGIVNREYQAQKAILADLEAGKISKDEFFAHAHEIMAEKLGKPVLAKAYVGAGFFTLFSFLGMTTIGVKNGAGWALLVPIYFVVLICWVVLAFKRTNE